MVWDYQRHTDCTEDLFRLDILQFEMLYTAYKLFMQVLKFFLSTVTSNKLNGSAGWTFYYV